MEITRETSPAGDIKHGHTVVGKTAVPLTTIDYSGGTYMPACYRGVIVRAAGAGEDAPNTDIVYVGRSAVTADNDSDTGGVPILPGGSIFLPVDDPSKVYVVSQSDNQDVAWLGV